MACGGGGIPVYRTEGNHLKGAGAVIDKDFASELLAEQLDADTLIILTAVEKVAINFGKPDQKWLDHLTPEEARQYEAEGQFAPGSMLPKVQAAVKFAAVQARPHRPHHPAGEGQGRHRRKNRHRRLQCTIQKRSICQFSTRRAKNTLSLFVFLRLILVHICQRSTYLGRYFFGLSA